MEKTNKNVGYHKCSKCDYKAATSCNIRRHLTQVHGVVDPKIHKCKLCGEMFVYLFEKRKHDQYECQKTNKNHKMKFRNEENLPTKKYNCTMCSYESSWKHWVQIHMAKNHNFQDPDFHSCRKCGKLYKTLPLLKSHIKNANCKKQGKVEVVKSYKCLLCNYQSKFSGNLLYHTKLVHRIKDPKIHKCETCGQLYSSFLELNAHMKECLPEETTNIRKHQTSLVCNICNNIFEEESVLTAHKRRCGYLQNRKRNVFIKKGNTCFGKNLLHRRNYRQRTDNGLNQTNLCAEKPRNDVQSKTAFWCETCKMIFEDRSIFNDHKQSENCNGFDKAIVQKKIFGLALIYPEISVKCLSDSVASKYYQSYILNRNRETNLPQKLNEIEIEIIQISPNKGCTNSDNEISAQLNRKKSEILLNRNSTKMSISTKVTTRFSDKKSFKQSNGTERYKTSVMNKTNICQEKPNELLYGRRRAATLSAKRISQILRKQITRKNCIKKRIINGRLKNKVKPNLGENKNNKLTDKNKKLEKFDITKSFSLDDHNDFSTSSEALHEICQQPQRNSVHNCFLCQDTFSDIQLLNTHLIQKHVKRPTFKVNGEGGDVLPKYNKLNNHVANENTDPTGKPVHKSGSIAGNQIINNLQSSITFEESGNLERTFKGSNSEDFEEIESPCKLCGQICLNESALLCHLKRH